MTRCTIGIAGESAGGKSTLAKRLEEELPGQDASSG
jgi:uridine kinase